MDLIKNRPKPKLMLSSKLTPKPKVRTCKCPELPLRKRRDILRVLNEYDNDVADVDEVDIGVVFHLCFKADDMADDLLKKECDYTLRLLNKDFTKQCRNFNNGEPIFKKTEFADVYNRYVNRAGTSNITFSRHEVKKTRLGTYSHSHLSMMKTDIKEQSPPVEPDRYLNLWIVDSDSDVFGYADYPWANGDKLDGIILSRNLFGMTPKYQQYNMNKMLTHCIGHWLGLYHIYNKDYEFDNNSDSFQDLQSHRGDMVTDTPLQKKQSTGNPYMDPRSWPHTKNGEDKEYHMFMNFMDNTEDLATFMFTVDQVRKMRLMIKLLRPRLLDEEATTDVPENIIKKIKDASKLAREAKKKADEEALIQEKLNRQKEEELRKQKEESDKRKREKEEKDRRLREESDRRKREKEDKERRQREESDRQRREKEDRDRRDREERDRRRRQEEDAKRQADAEARRQEELQRVKRAELEAKRQAEEARKQAEEHRIKALLAEERVKSEERVRSEERNSASKLLEDLKSMVQLKPDKEKKVRKRKHRVASDEEVSEVVVDDFVTTKGPGDEDDHLRKKYNMLKEEFLVNRSKYMVLKKEHMVLKNKYLLAKNKLVVLKNKELLKNWNSTKRNYSKYGVEISDEDSLSS